MNRLLAWIKPCNVFSSRLVFSRRIIGHLLCNEGISFDLLPGTCDLGHVPELIQGLSGLVQNLI